MKRRRFLQLFGAGLAAPMMPQIATGGAAPHLGAAIAHAKARVSVSAWGLTQALGVNLAQADVLMAEMAQRGAIAQIEGGQGRWAMSLVYEAPLPAHVQRQEAPKQSEAARRKSDTKTSRRKADPLMVHLHGLCVDAGYPIHEVAA